LPLKYSDLAVGISVQNTEHENIAFSVLFSFVESKTNDRSRGNGLSEEQVQRSIPIDNYILLKSFFGYTAVAN
jgi:hypothetical protein